MFKTFATITKAHPVQAGLGVLLVLAALGVSAEAAAQDPAAVLSPGGAEGLAGLAGNPWALVAGCLVVVAGQAIAAWKEHLAGHKVRADEAALRVRELEAELALARERALRAELTTPPRS